MYIGGYRGNVATGRRGVRPLRTIPKPTESIELQRLQKPSERIVIPVQPTSVPVTRLLAVCLSPSLSFGARKTKKRQRHITQCHYHHRTITIVKLRLHAFRCQAFAKNNRWQVTLANTDRSPQIQVL